MKKTLFLGTALMIGAVGFAQSGAKKAKDINPKYLQKAVSKVKITAEPKPTAGGTRVTPTIAKLRPSSVQGGSNPCGLQEFTTSYNAFGVGGGSSTSEQNCLSYNTDLNTLVWTQRGSKTWSLNSASGFYQATLINAATLATDSVIMYKGTSNPGRYPSGTLINPLGNTDIHNAYAVSFGPALDAGGTNWVGTAYTVKSLNSSSATGHTVPSTIDSYEDTGTGQLFGNCIGSDLLGSPKNDLTYINDGKTFVTVGDLQNADVTAADGNGDHNACRGAMFVKGVVNGGTGTTQTTTSFTVDTLSMIPDVHTGTLGYQLGEPRMAFGPDGMTGYVVMLARMATNYNNYSDSSMTPIVYKTTDGGSTWALQSCLLGYDWMGMHPEVEKNVGELTGNKRGYTFDFFGQGADVTVDKNNTLHLVTCVTDYEYTTAAGLDSLGIYSHLYDYDYVDYHPIIWDFMTDGNGWSTMMVDSIISSAISSSSTDTTSGSSPMAGASILGVHAHLQISRSLDGSKIFYGWADSDPNVVAPNIYGQVLNTNPDIMMKAWDLNTNMVTNTMNTTQSNPYTGSCFYPYLADISYNDGTNWVVPAVFTVGHSVLSASGGYNVYDASAQADYHYSNCGTFAAADFVNTPNIVAGGCSNGISKVNKAFDASITNYPNPFSSTTTITVNLSEAKAFSINVYNTIGALVYSKTVNGNVGTNNVTFDGSSLNAGVYYYTVNAGNQQTTKKMVIAK